MPAKKLDGNTVRRKIFSLYDEDLRKLAELCKLAGITSQSLYIRELICVAHAERIMQKKETPCFYGQEKEKFDKML